MSFVTEWGCNKGCDHAALVLYIWCGLSWARRQSLKCVKEAGVTGASMQEIVRDVIGFADVHESTTPREDTLASSPETSPHLQLPDASSEG